MSINDPDFICTKCKLYGGAVYLLLELLPVVIMMIIITVLHVSITDGFLKWICSVQSVADTTFSWTMLFLVVTNF